MTFSPTVLIMEPADLAAMYRVRFAGDADFRIRMWRLLCERVFQPWIPDDATVLELAAGHCEFINQIRAGRRIAVDPNPDTADHAAPGVEVLPLSATDIGLVPTGSVDVVFASNFLEHLVRSEIVATINEARRVLASGGRLILLQPSIRFCGRDFWMFLDHVTPVDDRALCELLEAVGFTLEKVVPRFLPYTTKGRLPSSILLLRIYLRLPVLWRIFGGQSLMVART
jgi:SAM-dependent methyltransferase